MKYFLFAFSLFFLQNLPSQAATLINLGPEFKAYVEKNRHSTPEERWQAWLPFEAAHEKYLHANLCDATDPDCARQRKMQIQKFFEELPNIESAMWELFNNAESITERKVSDFKKSFPDLQDRIDVVFLPSFLDFTGAVASIDGHPALLISPDTIAKRKDNLDIIFPHEFFHAYQFEKLLNKKAFITLASPLWFEGLAVYASMLLNPGISEEQALLDANLGQYCSSSENRITLARNYEKILPYTIEKAYPMIPKWFWADDHLPVSRIGYCLGLTVVKEAVKQTPLSSLIEMDETEFVPLISAILKNIK